MMNRCIMIVIFFCLFLHGCFLTIKSPTEPLNEVKALKLLSSSTEKKAEGWEYRTSGKKPKLVADSYGFQTMLITDSREGYKEITYYGKIVNHAYSEIVEVKAHTRNDFNLFLALVPVLKYMTPNFVVVEMKDGRRFEFLPENPLSPESAIQLKDAFEFMRQNSNCGPLSKE